MKLDEIDIKILEIIQNDGRITNAKLASRIGISPPAMLDRVKRLESSGVISKFVALVDRKKIGVEILAFVSVSLAVHQMSSLDNFYSSILELDEVLECYQISGDNDFILKVALKSLDIYSDFVVNRLTGIPGIQNIKSTFVLKTIKNSTAFPMKIVREKDHE
ncbi:Lrp/AsnC family transcriptional regulator [bacterium]|nr:Lrp/AsnC family transcriptional regulator [bacterium]